MTYPTKYALCAFVYVNGVRKPYERGAIAKAAQERKERENKRDGKVY